MSDRERLPGKFVWFELVTRDAKKAQAFYGAALGWKVHPFPMGAFTYEMILAGDTLDSMIGLPSSTRTGNFPKGQWLLSLAYWGMGSAVSSSQ